MLSYIDQSTVDLILGIFTVFIVIFVISIFNSFVSSFFSKMLGNKKNKWQEK